MTKSFLPSPKLKYHITPDPNKIDKKDDEHEHRKPRFPFPFQSSPRDTKHTDRLYREPKCPNPRYTRHQKRYND